MTARWKDRMERMARANAAAHGRALGSLTVRKAAHILEGLLSHPLSTPRRGAHHPVSLSHRMIRSCD